MWAGTATGQQVQLAIAADEDLTEALRAASLTVEAANDPDAARRDIVAAAQADYQRLLATLYEAGHFGPTISIELDGVEAAALPVVGRDEGLDVVRIEVVAGPQFLFGATEIAPVPRGTELPERFASGAPAGTEPIRQAAVTAIEAWRARGHAKAEIAAEQITARHPAERLDARLSVAPGPRLRYGPVFVDGADDVREGRISRIADLRQGRIFDPDEVREAARRLQRTGAFSSVAITEAEEIGPSETLPMTIRVAERLPRRFGVGAEIASEEGLGLTAFWLHRNLTGFADSFRVDGEIEGIGGRTSGEDYSLSFAYNRPATFNPETDLFVNGGVESLDQPNFSSDRAYIETGARRIVSDEFRYSYGIGYDYSETTDALGTREFSNLSFPLAATYDRRDDPLNPRDGYYVEAGLEPFYGFRTSGTGTIFEADLRGYQGFGEGRRTVVAARLQLGSVIGPDIDEVPGETLYFSGGGGTVRGQEFQSLGVETAGGDTIGGRSFLGLSTELRRDVTGNIGVVGFFDYGRISEDSGFSDGRDHTGAGLGLRYDTGIGPIRLDVGFPVSGPEDDGGAAVYIGIGQAF